MKPGSKRTIEPQTLRLNLESELAGADGLLDVITQEFRNDSKTNGKDEGGSMNDEKRAFELEVHSRGFIERIYRN